MTAEPTVKVLETPYPGFTVYGVYVNGELVGKVEKHVYAERVRYAGRMYGHDLAPKAHYIVSEVNGKYTTHQYEHSTRKAAVASLLQEIQGATA